MPRRVAWLECLGQDLLGVQAALVCPLFSYFGLSYTSVALGLPLS